MSGYVRYVETNGLVQRVEPTKPLPVVFQAWDGGTGYNPVGSVSVIADGNALANGLPVGAWGYNGASWDRRRNNHELAALASAARTASANGAALVNYNSVGMAVLVDITAVGAPAGSITEVNVQALIGATYKTVMAWTGLAMNAVERHAFLVYPGAASAAAWAAAPIQGAVPRLFRVSTIHADANSITYSVTCSMIGGA